ALPPREQPRFHASTLLKVVESRDSQRLERRYDSRTTQYERSASHREAVRTRQRCAHGRAAGCRLVHSAGQARLRAVAARTDLLFVADEFEPQCRSRRAARAAHFARTAA